MKDVVAMDPNTMLIAHQIDQLRARQTRSFWILFAMIVVFGAAMVWMMMDFRKDITLAFKEGAKAGVVESVDSRLAVIEEGVSTMQGWWSKVFHFGEDGEIEKPSLWERTRDFLNNDENEDD